MKFETLGQRIRKISIVVMIQAECVIKFILRREQSVSVTKTNKLVISLERRLFVVSITRKRNIVCGQNGEFLRVKAGAKCSIHPDLKCLVTV